MSQIEYNTRKREYKQLTSEQRAQVEILRRERYSQGKIARLLGVHQSTISRELRRNSVQQLDSELRGVKRYYADAAQRQMLERRKGGGNVPKYLKYPDIIKQIEQDILEKGWSPDASIGRLERVSGERCPITTRTFYNYIEKGVVAVKPIDLWQKVRRRPKRTCPERNCREIGKSIELRPTAVENRQEFGHWEIDGVIGKATDTRELMTLVERKTRMGIVIQLESRTQDGVAQGLRSLKREYGKAFSKIFKSITSDNGSEFLAWKRMERSGYKRGQLQTRVYYAHPYRASERGSNENYNGLLRRRIAKGASIDAMVPQKVHLAMEWVNSLPRRILNYRTAEEAFAKELDRLRGIPG